MKSISYIQYFFSFENVKFEKIRGMKHFCYLVPLTLTENICSPTIVIIDIQHVKCDMNYIFFILAYIHWPN